MTTHPIRDLTVRATCDFECITHVCTKGTVVTMPSNVAEPLIDEGKLELVKEMASAKPAAEKRG